MMVRLGQTADLGPGVCDLVSHTPQPLGSTDAEVRAAVLEAER